MDIAHRGPHTAKFTMHIVSWPMDICPELAQVIDGYINWQNCNVKSCSPHFFIPSFETDFGTIESESDKDFCL